MGEKSKNSPDADLPSSAPVPDQLAEEAQKEPEIVLTPEQKIGRKLLVKSFDMEHVLDIDVDKAVKIKDKFSLPDQIAQQVAEEAIAKILNRTQLIFGEEYVKKIKKKFFLPEETFQRATENGAIISLAEGNIDEFSGINNKFPLSETALSSPEARQAAKNGVAKCFSKGGSGGYNRYIAVVKKIFPQPEEILFSLEVQQGAKEQMIKHLTVGDFEAAAFFKDNFPLCGEALSSLDGQVAIRKGLVHLISKSGGIENKKAALEIKDRFSLPEDVFQLSIKEAVVENLSEGGFNRALDIKSDFSVPDEVLSSQECQQAADEGMIHYILNNEDINPADVVEFKDKLFMPEDTVSWAAKEAMVESLGFCRLDRALEIKDRFSLLEGVLSLPEIQRAAMHGFSGYLLSDRGDDNLYEAIRIKKAFSLPDEATQKIATEGFIRCCAVGDIDRAFSIRDEFSINITYVGIIEKFPDVKELVDGVDKISPGFSVQVEKSQDLLFSLFQFRGNLEQLLQAIELNPFLVDAVSTNPRMGSKLLIKFSELDSLSKENIATLFTVKKEILTGISRDNQGPFNRLSGNDIATLNKIRGYLPEQDTDVSPESSQNLGIDPESLEFRQLMQDRLREYKNNPEVLEEAEDRGIDSEQWLNYGETSYFQLESGAGLSFSETVATPLARIKETIDSYSYRIKEVLSQYRVELSAARIPLEDPKEIQEKIDAMRIEMEKARATGNEKKAQGIQRGIDGLIAKMANAKTVSLWDKLVGDIQAFQGLKNDVFSAQEKLIKTEEEYEEKASTKTPSGKEIQELKQKLTKLKEELRIKFGILESRIENFQNNLPVLLSPTLGDERTTALVQEIQTGLEEQFNHYRTDRSTLANLFSERSDREKEKMEGQPMSVFVWARNPDVDLYQGNYSPCCISVESGCASNSAESAIADYATDLGIQIVNIWDETKGEPVTAAWCWLGKDEKGKAALVVDNIESNPMYSINYPEQLTKQLFDFLKNYAQSIGAKKVVLGKTYNDLPTAGELAKMPDDASTYEKIGGYHRDDGYYLEAVDRPVKILWQKQERAKKVKAERKEKSVKFGKLETNSLSKEDFAGLLKMEEEIYPEDLIQGQAILQDIESGNGLEYSVVVSGIPEGKKTEKPVGYLVAVEDETDEGDPTVYLEDIAVLPEAQRQGVAWKMVKELIRKLQTKAKKENKPVLWDMHLRESSQGLLEKHKDELTGMGLKIIEEAFVPNYYDEREDALYRIYEVAIPR